MRSMKKNKTYNLRLTLLKEEERVEMLKLENETVSSLSKDKDFNKKVSINAFIKSTFNKMTVIKKGRFLNKTLKSVIKSSLNSRADEKTEFTSNHLSKVSNIKCFEKLSEKLYNISPIKTRNIQKSIHIDESFQLDEDMNKDTFTPLPLLRSKESSNELRNLKTSELSSKKHTSNTIKKPNKPEASSPAERVSKNINILKKKMSIPSTVAPLNIKNIIELNNYLFRTHILSEVDPLAEVKKKSIITENYYSKNKLEEKTIQSEQKTENYEENHELPHVVKIVEDVKTTTNRNVGAMILDLHHKEYDEIDYNKTGYIINDKNLQRLINVRKIVKNRIKKDENYPTIESLKEENLAKNKNLTKNFTINPSFIKTKFKPSTLKKYQGYF